MIEKAYLGNGCFWCTEAVFQKLVGVITVKNGYSGGAKPNPSYKEVCTGTTGHAECLEITFDADIVSFETLLQVFFETHDPTTLNRQGNDVGTQYRSVIFFTNDAQKDTAAAYINQLNLGGTFKAPIVTELTALSQFFGAENYHDNYYLNNTAESYCQFVVRPKVEKFKKLFADKMKG